MEFASHPIVHKVQDGDTLTLVVMPIQPILMRWRLADIDAPERGESYHKAATNMLLDLVRGTSIVIEEPEAQSDHLCSCNRSVCYLWAGDLLVNAEMVRQGMAVPWTPKGPSQHTQRILEAGNDAYTNERGIWSLQSHRLQSLGLADAHIPPLRGGSPPSRLDAPRSPRHNPPVDSQGRPG